MPDLPPPPDAAPSSFGFVAALRSWVAGTGGIGPAPFGASVPSSSESVPLMPAQFGASVRRVAGVVGGGLALVVVAVVAWRAYASGGVGGGGPPPELSMPRAGAGRDGAAGSGSPTAGSEGRSTGDEAVGVGAGSGGSLGSGSGSAGGSAAGGVVVAHVAGAVARPGLYRLGGAPRAADAIDAAGGPAPDADLDAVNLAAAVADGERVYLPRRGEAPPAAVVASGGAAASAGPLDLNTATAEQLEDLPGVGPATASAILAYRKEHGRFRSVDELLEVRGIGDARLAELRPKVRVR